MIRALRSGESPPEGVEPRRYRNSNGYVRLRWPLGGMEFVECYEHRFIMGAKEGDHVHHRNGNTSDNRPENLEVLTPLQHRREHARYDIEEMGRLYREGMSTPKIGELFGCPSSTVFRALRCTGVPTRSISESLTHSWRERRG